MRLKKLILHGFKSFADRTEFVFDAPITGIVGPNGCGKSNVVDGFKWVLGEQSAKSLRGEAMLDVIFNGSGARKPAGMSEVVLVFENPRKAGGARTLNVDVDEVAVGRRLFRDGTSEYHLNNHASRLKDVRELFLDTGVGVDAYSVIEQGRVAALLEADPEERRLIFEEAAGISKFKARKKEAQRKLEKVDQNLLRVNDIVAEVEKQLRSVKVQAGRARTYQEHSTRLRELRLTYALQEYHTWHGQVVEFDKQREDAQFRLDDASADLARNQNELAENREKFDAASQLRQRTEFELVQSRAAMQSAKQRQGYAEQQLGQIADQLAQFERDREAIEDKSGEVVESLEAENAALARLTGELDAGRKAIDARQVQFRDGQLQLNQLNQQIEGNKSAILDLMRKLAQANNALGAIEIERKNIAAQQGRIGERRRVVAGELETLEGQRAELQGRLEDALAAIADRQARLEEKRRDAAALGKQISRLNENLGAAKEHRSGLKSRQKLLQDLEARREGVSEGVKSVLRQRDSKFPFVRGLVADVLRVDVEHARMIEAALDGRDQWLVTADAGAARAAREKLEDLEGRVNVLCVDEIRGRGRSPVAPETDPQEKQPEQQQEGGLGAPAAADYDWDRHGLGIRFASDLVRFEPGDAPLAHHLLGRTIVVGHLAAAAELRRAGPAGFRYVTPAGEILEADGTLRAGPLTAAMGLLSRRSELEAVTLQIAEVDERVAALTEQLSHGNAQSKALEESQNALRNAVYQANTTKVELTSQLAQNNDKQSALRREQPVLDRELQGFMDQVGRLQAREVKLAEEKTAFEGDQSRRQAKVAELAAAQQRTAENLKEWGEELTATRVALGQIQEKQIASREAVQRFTAARGELAQQHERVVRSRDSLAGRRKHVESELASAREAEAALEEKTRASAAQLAGLEEQVRRLSGAVQELGRKVESLRAEHGDVEGRLHKLQMKLGELRVRVETLVQRAMDELQLDVPAQYAAFSAPAEDGAPGPGYQPADMDWDAVADEIKILRDKIQRLGNVNLDAISEQDELEQRQTFLSTQVHDLADSKAQLETLIDEINAESSLRFEQTFNTVREHFQGLFRKLFGGGSADIYLETEVEVKPPKPAAGQEPEVGPDGQALLALPTKKKIEVLDAGIEIIARPPGKKPVSISQLSGGEKTMTCVALLMSIFKSKPSPFCILDEVDAALDEANNQRFNLIVQEFLEQSQFIIITHSKRTMQIADVLYGVTMQEQGVSKRVAVKFDQVDAQGHIKEGSGDQAAA